MADTNFIPSGQVALFDSLLLSPLTPTLSLFIDLEQTLWTYQ